MRAKTKSRIALLLAAALLAAAGALGASLCSMHDGAAHPDPAPRGAEAEAGEDPFPAVDWDYWRSVNPDVIGWITVPGTDVDYPVVMGPESEPDYYLRHDVYGRWNMWGCPYLDASCAEGGLLHSRNAVVYGHHMRDGTMFAQLAGYSDAAWARDHAEVLVQTPEERAVMRVFAADVVNAQKEQKVTEFADAGQYRAWLEKTVEDSRMVLDGDARPERVVTLCTCSYHYWGNERTLAFCAPDAKNAALD